MGERVAKYLGTSLVNRDVLRFADGETLVHVKDLADVKGKHITVVQSTCKPVNDSVMELFLMVTALRRAGAASITCAIPYYGYSRQDVKTENRAVSLSAADVGSMLEFVGVDRILTIDLHAQAVQNCVSPRTVFEDFKAGFLGIDWFIGNLDPKDDICIVAPDAGAVKRAKEFHRNFEFHSQYKDKVGVALMHKERLKANVVESVTLIGDVRGKTCIIVDDMTDTSGTLCKAATELKQQGAKKVYAFITHGIFSGPAADRIRESELEAVVCTDTIKVQKETEEKMGGKLKYASVDLMLAEIIRRSYQNENYDALQEVPTCKN